MVDKNLGQNIVRRRKELNLTQVQLACKIVKANSFLCDIEKGRVTPSLRTIYKIAEALEVEAVDLFRQVRGDDNV